MASVPSRSWMASAARARRGEGKLETMTLIVEERDAGPMTAALHARPREARRVSLSRISPVSLAVRHPPRGLYPNQAARRYDLSA